MARDSEGNYYLVGSHSGKTQDERDQHAKLIRFRLKTGRRPAAHPAARGDRRRLGHLLAARRSPDPALEHEGLATKAVDQRKIEGLAIREQPAVPTGGPAASW